jgi:uncharacterized protein
METSTRKILSDLLDEIKASKTMNPVRTTFSKYDNLTKVMSDWAGGDIRVVLDSEDLNDISEMISDYISDNPIQSFGEGGQFSSDLDIVHVKVGDKTYKLLCLTSKEEKERGLMNVEEMDDDEGAIFDYTDTPKENLSFWMKDTSIPLRILFINRDGVVISAHDGEPYSKEPIIEQSEPVYWVIELNQSQQIGKGTYTNLSLDEYPENEPTDEDEDDNEEHPELGVNKLFIYGSDGNVQGEIAAGCRIFSRKSTAVIIRKAKKAYASKLDKDYKALGRYVFNEIKAQDNRGPEYVEG